MAFSMTKWDEGIGPFFSLNLRMEDSAVFGVVEVFTGKHRVNAFAKARFFGQCKELGEGGVVKQILRQVDVEDSRAEGVLLGAVFFLEKFTQSGCLEV